MSRKLRAIKDRIPTAPWKRKPEPGDGPGQPETVPPTPDPPEPADDEPDALGSIPASEIPLPTPEEAAKALEEHRRLHQELAGPNWRRVARALRRRMRQRNKPQGGAR